MNFLDQIFARLETDFRLLEVLQPARQSVDGRTLLDRIFRARAFLATKNLKKGDRVVLLAPNNIDWVAADLAIMAEGLIVVPMYPRQAAEELVTMMKDCSPSLIICGNVELRDAIARQWPETPPQVLLTEIFLKQDNDSRKGPPALHADSDPVTIIYTSGTSGEAKGVMLTVGNVSHMLDCTSARLDKLMHDNAGQNNVFHYLPFCFAGSWIMLLTCLLRRNKLTLNSDLTKLAEEMRSANADYFLNVPQLLERMRKAVDEQLWKTRGLPLMVYQRVKAAYMRVREGKKTFSDSLWLSLASLAIFPTIRKKMIGANLKALICGSAPLNVDTQLFFMMLGIPVLQVYGLTETTAICTMDDPAHVEPGRVGPAINGIQMKLGENDEILVRGPNIFHGYWNRPAETAQVLRDGWFHTGDQGELSAGGNWKIVGRIKNLLILNSGHNVAPEPIEEEMLAQLTDAQQVVLIGNGRSYLSAIVTGNVSAEHVRQTINATNQSLPHYKQIRAFKIVAEPFTIDSGLLTANGKLKRDLITGTFSAEIEEMYAIKQAV